MTRVYLGRLNSSVRERDVEKFFRDYGKLREVTLKGTFGFVVSQLEIVNSCYYASILYIHYIICYKD